MTFRANDRGRILRRMATATMAVGACAGGAQAVTFELTSGSSYDNFGNGNFWQAQVDTVAGTVSILYDTFTPIGVNDGGDQVGLPVYGMARNPVTGILYVSPDPGGGPLADGTGHIVQINPQPAGTNWTYTDQGTVMPTGAGTVAGDTLQGIRAMGFTTTGSAFYVGARLQDSTQNQYPAGTLPRKTFNINPATLGPNADPPATIVGPTQLDFQGYKGIGVSNTRYSSYAFTPAGDLYALTFSSFLGSDTAPSGFLETFLVKLNPADSSVLVNYGPIAGTGGFIDGNGDIHVDGWARGLVVGADGKLYAAFDPGGDGIAGNFNGDVTTAPAKLWRLDFEGLGAWTNGSGQTVPHTELTGDLAEINVVSMTIGVALPEPASAALILAGGSVLLRRRRA